MRKPVIRDARYFLAHTPGLVRYGFKPSSDITRNPAVLEEIASHLRSYGEAVSYPPNRAYLGSIYPDDLGSMARPWFNHHGVHERRQPHGDIMPEDELYGMMKAADAFDLMWLEEGFVREVKHALARNPLVWEQDLEKLGDGHPHSAIESLADDVRAMPLFLKDGRMVGCVQRASEETPALSAAVILENLACKATAGMALRTLLHDTSADPGSIGYVLNTGEEAVGDAYQRGGGNLAKAIGELCSLEAATGADIKAFCCAPVHALVIAGALVSSGVFDQVVVVGGCSLPKLGMNYHGHVEAGQPIIEDVLASVAIMVGPDDGVSPVMRLDSVGHHNIGAGSSIRQISRTLVTQPLNKTGLRYQDIDKYAIELQNAEITEPVGSGDVTERNYRLIGAMAVQDHEIERSDLDRFVNKHGMPGFSSTQGHIASAVPFLGHAVDQIKDGKMERAMFIAKGSLFLGRMTQMSDGFSFILEKNPAV